MSLETQGSYEFGPFLLDPAQQQLFDAGRPVSLTPKAFDTLVVLVRNHGRLVTKGELLQAVWPDAFVEESTLAQNVFRLRRILGDDGDTSLYIETIPKRGYRFIAPVKIPTNVAPPQTDPQMVPLAQPIPVLRNAAIPRPSPEARPNLNHAQAPHTQRPQILFLTTAIILIAVGFFALYPRESVPRVTRSTQITNFGRAADPLAVAGDRLLLCVRTGGSREVAQISALSTAPSAEPPLILPSGLPKPHIYDVSLDGSQLLVGASDGDELRALWAMPSAGGAPRRLANLTATGAAFSPDRSQIVYTAASAIYLANADGSSPRQLAAVSGLPLSPRWSPNGQVIRFTLQESSQQGMSLWEIPAAGGSPHALFPALNHPTDRWGTGPGFGNWSRDGRYFYFMVGGTNFGSSAMSAIWVVPESSSLFGKLLGRSPAPQQIFINSMPAGSPVPSPDGSKLFFTAHQEDRELMKFDPAQNRFVPWLNGLSVGSIAYSRDGNWVTYVTFSDGVLWRARTDGSEALRLADSPTLPFAPCFSPDGSLIAFHDARDRHGSRISIVPRDGGQPIPLTDADDSSATWFPDGKSILYLHRTPSLHDLKAQSRTPSLDEAKTESRKPNNPDPPGIYRIDVASGKKSPIPGSESATDPVLSPDGRFIAAPASDFRHLRLYTFATNQWRDLASGDFLRYPRWSADSQVIYFQDYLEGREQPIYRVTIQTGKAEKVMTSAQFQRPDVFHGYLFQSLAPDGQPVVSLLRNKSDIYALDLDLPK